MSEKNTEYFKLILTDYDGQTQDAYSVKFGEDPIGYCPVNRSDPFATA